MAYLRILSRDDGGMVKSATGADVVSAGLTPVTINAAGAQVLSAASLTAGVILRQGAGAVTDTQDTAVNIMQALYGNTGSNIELGETFRVLFSNQGASTVTIGSGTGVTTSGNTAVLANTVKTLMFVCTAKGTQTYNNGVFTNVGATFNCICL
jgi:hypothetical protein